MPPEINTGQMIESLVESGLLIKDMAQKVNVAPNTLSRIKNGVHKNASPDVANKIKRMYARMMKENANG